MTSLIGAGLGARRRAQQGFGAVAQLEARENRQMDLLDAAREQQEMSNLGTGAGFGAMYGLSNLPTAAATTTSTSAPLATLASTSPDGGISVLKGLETAAGMAPNTLGATTATVGASTGAAAGTTGAAASTGAAAGTTGAAAGGAGSALATLAMPIAIGLGAAFLINKLFD